MDTLQSAVRRIKPNCYMASVDLRDAYYSIPIEKINRINDKCFELLSEVNMTIHDLAEVVGLLVSSFPGVLYGPLFIDTSRMIRQLYLEKAQGTILLI